MGLTDNNWPLKYLVIIAIFVGCLGLCVGFFHPSVIEGKNFVVINETEGTMGNASFRALNIWDMLNPYFIFDILTYSFLPFELRIAFNIVNIVIMMTVVYLGIAFVKGIFPFNLIMGGA
jgi:hypothetical protein